MAPFILNLNIYIVVVSFTLRQFYLRYPLNGAHRVELTVGLDAMQGR
jgi:hypothetical protein